MLASLGCWVAGRAVHVPATKRILVMSRMQIGWRTNSGPFLRSPVEPLVAVGCIAHVGPDIKEMTMGISGRMTERRLAGEIRRMHMAGLRHHMSVCVERLAPRRPVPACIAVRGFTLIELLVTITIVSVLVAMLFPALNLAREASRKAACGTNLRQFGQDMAANLQRNGALCTGAFDWLRDGCVTEVGWVADLVEVGTPVGKMLCPSHPSQISRTFNDLLNAETGSFDSCVDRLGSTATTTLDGKTVMNPCRAISEKGLGAGTEPRRELVEKQVFEKHFNTNYTASWWLVRSGVLLDANGNLRSEKSGCAPSLLARHSTLGPLTRARADTAAVSASFIPLLGCGALSQMLTMSIGPNLEGTPTVQIMTGGPVTNPGMATPSFSEGTPREGEDGSYAAWKATLQDYRNFGPVHRGACNLLFADGSVRTFKDADGDGMFNNGFLPTAENRFGTKCEEFPKEEVFSEWALKP